TMVACQRCGDPDGFPEATFRFQVTALKPSVTASPASGLPGATITLTGQGWDPGIEGAIYQTEAEAGTGSPIGSFTPGQDGSFTPGHDHSFTTTFKVPQVPTGPYTMVACQQCGNPDSSVRAPFTFQVAAIVGSGTLDLTPSSGRQGDRIQVGGRGWSLAGGVVRIYVNPTTPISGDPDAEVLPSAEGTFETLFLVPRLARGSYTV